MHVEKETRKTNYVRAPRKHQLQCSYLDLADEVGDNTYVSRRVLIHEESASRDTHAQRPS
jgi:hypothetical protein